MCAWAKFPSRWIKGYDAPYSPKETDAHGALAYLSWSQYKSSGTYALLVLIALASLANDQQRTRNRRELGYVRATYEDIHQLTLLAKASISKALRALEDLGVLNVDKEGSAHVYELVGINVNGDWCMLPNVFLLKGSNTLRRMMFVHENARRKTTLNTLKIYLLLLAFRDTKSGVSRLGYDNIERYGAIRREDIRAAISTLLANGLCSIVTTAEMAYEPGQRVHNRYRILGFQPGDAIEADSELLREKARAYEIAGANDDQRYGEDDDEEL